jgi:hypothetical protein
MYWQKEKFLPQPDIERESPFLKALYILTDIFGCFELEVYTLYLALILRLAVFNIGEFHVKQLINMAEQI